MTIKHDKAWRAALKNERGIAVSLIESTIMEAWEHPDVPADDVDDAKLAVQRSYLLFAQSVDSGNALLRELSMVEGQRAFDNGRRLHTLLQLQPLHEAHCKRVAGGRKGAQVKKEQDGGRELRPRIAKAIGDYKGDQRKMASTLAKKFGCTPTYVRKIKNETALT